ncbi:hypothetical protein APHAL10511_007068 [Amanita phalloides]|nr:hypothetical protein APHAL10511_007068 [Amanita phalloides]
MSVAALRRIHKELADIKNNPIDDIVAEPHEDDLFSWKCSIKAASDSPYKNGTFHFNLSLPQNYPFKPPTVNFTTKIYHPGINEEGAICVPVLRDEWKPTVTLSSVLGIIQEKVNNPSADDPFEPDIAALMQNDKAKFLATAREYTKKYAITSSTTRSYVSRRAGHVSYTESLSTWRKRGLPDESLSASTSLCCPEKTTEPLPFSLSSKRSDAQRIRVPFSIQPDTLPELSQACDFRTSLILRDLSKQFSVLRSPTGEPVTVQDLKSKFALQRARGAQNQITEEEEVMLLETLGRMRSRTSAPLGKSQDSVTEAAEQHSVKSMSTANSVIQTSVTSSPSGKSTKRYSNNLFGSGRLRDYTYFRNAGVGHGRSGSTRAPSTETSISIQDLPDSLQPLASDNSSIKSNIDKVASMNPSAISEEHAQHSPVIDPSLLKRASMALAAAIKELEETEDEVVMPRLPRPSPDSSSRNAESIIDLAKSSQSSLHQPSIVEAGTAISSDKQVITPYQERRASPAYSRTLPGYVPGMPRPMTPRDIELDEQRSHSATPRAMSPLSSDVAETNGSESTSALRQSSRSVSPTGTAPRPSTPSRSTPLFLQRSPSGRRTPDNGLVVGDTVNFDSPLNSSVMSKRRPSLGHTFQPATTTSRPSTPSNVIWNVGLTEANHKLHGHERNGSWASDTSDGQSSSIYSTKSKQTISTSVPESPPFDLDNGPNTASPNRMPRSPTPTHGSPRSPAFAIIDISPRNGSKRSSRQNTSSPFHFDHFAPLVLLPVVNSSRSSLESTGSSYHSWDAEKDHALSIFFDTDTQQPAWHDLSPDRINSFVSSGSVDEDEWDPEEIIGRYAGLKKSDFRAMQEKLVCLSIAREDARERAPSIRRRRPSTSQSNYSNNGRDRVASPSPASPTAVNLDQQLKATAVLNAMADSIQSRQLDTINTAVQRVPDAEPSPITRRHRDLAQALFGDDIEKEREQTPKPVPQQTIESPATEYVKALTSNDLQGNNEQEMPASSVSPSQSGPEPAETVQDVNLVKEVQQKADAAMLALRKTPTNPEQPLERSAQGSISRRRVDPSQISEPRLVSASTSVDTIPVRPPQNNPGTSKIGSRFRKLRGTLRAKNTPFIGDESHSLAEANSPRPSQDMSYDGSHLKTISSPVSAVGNGGIQPPIASPPSAGPGLKGFMARFRSKKGADNATLDRRGIHRISPSVVSLAASQVDRTTIAPLVPNDRTVPSSTSSLQQKSDHAHPMPYHQTTTANGDSNEIALRQLFDAASNLGLDQNALNALLARTPSLSKRMERPAVVRNATTKILESADEDAVQDESLISRAARNELVPSNPEFAPSYPERNNSGEISVRKSDDHRQSQDGLINNTANVVVRRTIIYPSDSRGSPSPLDVTSLLRKNSRRRRGSITSGSSRSIQDRAPTPPPPKSPTSKSFSNGSSPPVPQIPRSLLPNTEPPKVPHSPTGHSFEKFNSAYDSLYEMYSEDSQITITAGNASLNPVAKGQSNVNPDAHAIELIELANGETIWSIVNGLRDEDDESLYPTRTSFTSELSARDGNSDGVPVYVKEHQRNGSKGSGTSFASRRRLLHGKARPETKVYYSSPAHIGRLIESLSQGTDVGKAGHPGSSSVSSPPSTTDAHWTVEERLDHMLNSINH